MDWEDLRHFLAVARAGTVSGAAKALGTSPSTVIKRIRDLETAIGAPLFDRSREGYTLTEFGRSIFCHAETTEAGALAIERLAGGNPDVMTGSIRVTTTELVGRWWIAPLLPKFYARYPDLSVELDTSFRIANLSRSEADLSVRPIRPERGDLVIRRLIRMAFRTYARPPFDESNIAWIGFDELMQSSPVNQEVEARMGNRTPILRTNSFDVNLAAARAGVGQTLLPCFIAEEDPLLAPVPESNPLYMMDWWLVVHRDLQRSPRVRAMMEFLIDAAQADRPRLEATAEPLDETREPSPRVLEMRQSVRC